MNGYIGCCGLIGIAVFIALLFARRKKIENEMTEFYKENSLFRIDNAPQNVRESLGGSDNLSCCRANLTTADGENVEFYWWEWYLKSTTMVNRVPTTSYDYHLAVSFAPNTVSDEFARQAIQRADKSDDDAAQKIKDFFVLNTETPYRADKLADGTLIICWQVINRRDVYDAKIEWLKNNVLPSSAREINAPETIQAVIPDEPKISEAVAPDELKVVEITVPEKSEIAKIAFYKHDNYATLRHKFNSAWTNLDLELHHSSAKFQHEGYDEFDSDAVFGNLDKPDEIAFTLIDEIFVDQATRLFSDFCGGAAYILRDGVSTESMETLAYCNSPFRLPLNEFAYGEFKRRFSERWTNLSIELYDDAPRAGGLWRGDKELADDFEMENLKHADKAFLHDYIYISTWGEKLVYIRVAAAIKNNKLGIYCEGNLRNAKLKNFNEAENAEAMRILALG